MSGWKKAKIGDFISVKHGYAFPGEGIIAEDNGVVLVTPGNFRVGGGFKDSGKKFFKGEYPADYVLKAGDFIVTMTDLSKESDTLGYSAIVPASSDYIYLHNQRIGLVEFHSTGIDRGFLYWLMRTKTYQHEIVAGASGTTVKHTSPSRIADVEISVPPLPTQKKIAAVLGALDDKIENNRKICKTLEEQAQAIFKSWFVDFDPFGGKRPDGWKDGSLTDIAVYQNGLAMQKFRPEDGDDGLPVLKIRELRAGDCDAESERCRCDIDDRVKIHSGDVIFSWSGSLLVDVWTGCDAGLNQHLFKVTSDKYEPWFFYFWTKHHLAGFIKIAADKATTMGHIQREHLESAKVLIPNDDQLKKLSSILAPVYERMVFANKESRALAELRDALLPKLMSGEIDVEKVVV